MCNNALAISAEIESLKRETTQTLFNSNFKLCRKLRIRRSLISWLVSILAIAVSVKCCAASCTDTRKRPHVLFILVDDLGWGDVGYHQPLSREIQTPTIDNLAQKEGLILDRHYVHSSCTGTRVSLQSGRLPVHVQTALKLPEDPSSGMPRNMTGFAQYLRSAGYHTHYVGKWDSGMTTPKHTPYGRGYESSLHYFEHKNDYWSQHCMQSSCCPNYGLYSKATDFWEAPQPKKSWNLTLVDLWDTDKPAAALNGTDYEEFIFLKRMTSIIRNYASNYTKDVDEPLFLFYAPHVAHCPLQVPKKYLDKFNFGNDQAACSAQTPSIGADPKKDPAFSCRNQYHAMVNLLDDIIDTLTTELKNANLWDNTLLIFTSDNGGPTKVEESGSTNFDLRGGKYSDWEGGVRAVAFVSGGFLPERSRGKILEEPVHITDWYTTLVKLAGVDGGPRDDSQGGRFPPIDSLDLWPLLSGAERASPRTEIPLSKHALIQHNYKLLWNPKQDIDQSGWTGPVYPNASSSSADIFVKIDCREGCLFDVVKDRGEHVNLAQDMPVRVQAMKQRLLDLSEGYFENDDKGDDACPGDIDMPCACWIAINKYGGFLGPYQEVSIPDSPSPKTIDPEQLEWYSEHSLR